MTSDVLLGLEKALRYRALPHLVGRKIVISGVADVDAQVKEALSPDIPEFCQLDCNPVWMEGTIAKGILDLTFFAPNEMLDCECTSGLSLLQDLRLLYPVTKEFLVERIRDRLRGIEPPPTLELPGYISDGDLTPSCYEALLEQAQGNQIVIRLFLQGEHPGIMASSGVLKVNPQWNGITAPDGYFPHCYDVKDACIANARSVWMSRHCYM